MGLKSLLAMPSEELGQVRKYVAEYRRRGITRIELTWRLIDRGYRMEEASRFANLIVAP